MGVICLEMADTDDVNLQTITVWLTHRTNASQPVPPPTVIESDSVKPIPESVTETEPEVGPLFRRIEEESARSNEKTLVAVAGCRTMVVVTIRPIPKGCLPMAADTFARTAESEKNPTSSFAVYPNRFEPECGCFGEKSNPRRVS